MTRRAAPQLVARHAGEQPSRQVIRGKGAASRGQVLPLAFYARDTEIVARQLLGAVLECRTSRGVASGRIVETEAYIGEHDLACHAAAGHTPRTAPLYGGPGIAYVYFIYGMYWCFNAVTRERGLPSAVLIRAIEPLEGVALMALRRYGSTNLSRGRSLAGLTNGPGKLCQALGIDGSYTWHALQRPPLVIRRGIDFLDEQVTVAPRIGISRCADWPLRWYVTDNPYVSKARARPSGQKRERDR